MMTDAVSMHALKHIVGHIVTSTDVNIKFNLYKNRLITY